MNSFQKFNIKTFAITLLSIGLVLKSICQSDYRIPKKTKKILFLGNSITYSGQYIAQVETYLKLEYPKNKFEFLNLGLPSETVSQLSENNHANGRFPRPALQERLSRVLSQTKPDLVFANYGMNDGIYLPFDENRFQKYKDGIEWLHSEVEMTGAKIIHLTPPIYDDLKGKEYSNVLDNYSNWLLSKKTDNWQVADIHYAMKKYVQNKRSLDSTFTLAKDGIHPNETGHWIMAKALLIFLGEKEISQYTNANEVFVKFKNGPEIAILIEQKQTILKDSWLTTIGHKRPEMPKGLPLIEAMKKAKSIENQVKKLLK